MPERTELAPRRAAFHVTACSGWINDPNGLSYREGIWHAFYQHEPDSDGHGVMHWGHAHSTDLLRWQEDPVALSPDHLGEIFSGSVVVDHEDSAGFGPKTMVALFTHHKDDTQQQSLAFSPDGVRWTMYERNPVLPSNRRDFRDPKVIRYIGAGAAHWLMVVAADQDIEFYRSDDLRSWAHASTHHVDLPTGSVCECPDLLPIAKPDGTTDWVLTYCADGLGPLGHCGTVGVLGDFDGWTFTPTQTPVALDRGPDFYACQSFFDSPSPQPTIMGWANCWHYATLVPSTGRRGVLSLPRTVEVVGSEILVHPAHDFGDSLPGLESHPVESSWTSEPDQALHLRSTGPCSLRIISAQGLAATVDIDAESVRIERHTDLAPDYDQAYVADHQSIDEYEVLIDHGILELWSTDGRLWMTALIFAGESFIVEPTGEVTARSLQRRGSHRQSRL